MAARVVQGSAGAARGRPRRYSTYTIALAKAAHDADIPTRVIAHYLGVSRWMVQYWCRDSKFAHIKADPFFRENLARLFGE